MDGIDTLNYLLENKLTTHSGRVLFISLAYVLRGQLTFADVPAWSDIILDNQPWSWLDPSKAEEENMEKLQLQRSKAIQDLKKQKILELLEAFSNAHIPNYNL